jgi:hypothetical protein
MAQELAGKSGKQDIQRAGNQANQAHSEATTDKTLNSYDNKTAQ